MSEHKQELEKRLWAIANELRGNMGADEFKDYILGFIFFKVLSEKMEKFALVELDGEIEKYSDIEKDPELLEELHEETVESLGYFIEPKYLFHNIAERAKNKELILEDLGKALKLIEESALGHESEHDFTGLFEDVDLTSTKLGRTVEQKNKLISEVIKHLDEINFGFDDTEMDVLGIDASNLFEKNKNKNMLTDEHVEEILKTYEKRKEIEKFSHLATMEEIAENDYNLNIPRYVDTFEEEEEIDLEAVVNEIGALDKKIESVDAEIKRYCDELGIKAPIL